MRLIDADATIDSIRECVEAVHNNYESDMEQGYLNAIECVEEQPTIELPSNSGHFGWVCPVCGRGLSPYTAVCPCQNQTRWEITCG